MDVVRCVHYFFSRKDAKKRRDFFNHRFRRLILSPRIASYLRGYFLETNNTFPMCFYFNNFLLLQFSRIFI